jgi:tetratricopeptide (TPR) repeat protein
MTTYRTIVSWLAFFLLLWRGSWLTFVFVMDHFDWHRIVGPDTMTYLLAMADSNLKEAIVWGLLWGPVALMILAPWLCASYGKCRRLSFAAGLENDTALLLNLLGRWAFTFAWLAALLQWMPRGVEAFLSWNPTYREEPYQGYFTGIFIPWAISVLCAMLIAPEFSRLASSGLTAFIDAVFFPGGREAKPPYTLKLARFYVQKKRWDEAEAEYARMLSFHPDQPEAWAERLAIALKRGEEADPPPEKILAASLKKVTSPAARERLQRIYEAARRNKPENGSRI